jgi:5-methylcytosine-specific restriction endonuclease McrA
MDTKNLPKTRAEAKAIGASHYFTGLPCKHGHIAPRKTKGACVDCLKEEWKEAAEKRIGYFKEYNQSNAGRLAKRNYYARNREAVIARAQARPDEQKTKYKVGYKERNPELYKELVNIRRRRFRQATPKWLTVEHKTDIRVLYRTAIELSRLTGGRYAVDHIVPLVSEVVCGLHVPWNLRVITQEENLKKSNRLDVAP